MIRKMEEADLAAVLAIENRCFSVPWSEHIFRETLDAKAYICLTAETAGGIAGYAVLLCIGPEADVANIAVHPDCRNRHIGRELLEELLAAGMRRGIAAFTLEVRAGNAAAIHLYEKAGFVSAGIRPGYYEKPEDDALIMWKKQAE